ncbi:MAG: thioester reductase domain-containing protein, partial [Psychrosphaera sp.]|nr:thioester reductase domain-containing protein [Psychrosphaera sp.]
IVNNLYVGPRNALEQALCTIWQDELGVERVGIEDNFFHLGGNSLRVMRTVDTIKRQLDSQYSVKQFYIAPTISRLVDKLPENEVVVLHHEARLDDDIVISSDSLNVVDDSDILLTGATGFVGRYLLAELLENTQSRVFCLVRADSLDAGLTRIRKAMVDYGLWQDVYHERIDIVLGDLAKANLGIGPQRYQQLSLNIGRVYHCATHMDHLATFEQMKAINVDGVKQVLKFVCTNRHKQLEYLSTTGVYNAVPGSTVAEQTPIEHQIHYRHDGYLATKWVAEKLVMLANEKGIGANIHRLGLITGDNISGKNDPTQWFNKLIVSCLNSGCCFKEKQLQCALTPVDFVAKSIRVLSNSSGRGAIYHLTHPNPVPFVDMVKMYNTSADKKLDLLEYGDFIRQLKRVMAAGVAIPIDYQISEQLQMDEAQLSDSSSRGGLIAQPFEVCGNSTISRINLEGMDYPVVDVQQVMRYFDVE